MSAGEWLPSIVTAEMLQGYQDSGMLPRHGCRAPPFGEEEPLPQEGERVLLLSHVDRGFSLPPHPFLLDFLTFTGAQLHHIVPNAITLLASFFTLCEGFLGIEPHWHLFRNIYTIKPQKVKKSGEGGGVEFNHLCGGLFLAKRTGVQYFPSSLPDSVKNWQNSWFYCKVEEGPGVRTLPPYSDVRLTDSQGWNPRLTNAEKEQVLPLMLEIVRLKTNGLDAMDLISTFVIRRTQPLQARARGMWTYTGLRDDTRYSNAEMQTEEYEHRMRVITSVTHGLQVVGRVRPLDSLHPPTLPNIAQYHSPIPLAPRHPAEEDEDSNTGARIEVEAGDEMESNVNSPPVTSEIRSKSNQDRDSAREGLVRSRKRSLPPSSGEGSSKLPALSPSHGKVAPMKTKKNLTTLGGRKVSPSGGVAEAVKTKTAAANVVAPPRRTLRVVRNVRPSGSESLPGVEGHDPETFEDVSTCGVTDFPVMDTIPEHTSAEMNVDVDARVDNVEANPDQAAPEPTILTPTAAVDDLPASPALPEIHASTTAHETAPASSSPISADTPIEDAIVSGLKGSLLKASQFESRLHELASEAESMRASMHEACKLGSSVVKLQEENAATKRAYEMLQEEHKKLQKQHAADSEAAKKAFDAKVKENDDFVKKMKKEIDQAEKRAKEKKTLEKQVSELLETDKKKDAAIAKLQSDLEKLSELQAKEKETHKTELETARKAVNVAEEYCAGRFAVFSETLALYSTNPEAEQARMTEFAEIMKKDNYTPVTTEFALARGLLTMRCAKAAKFAEEVMGVTLTLKDSMSPGENNRVSLDSVVPFLQGAPQQFARWKRSSARSGANYALALTKAHFTERVHNLERVGGGDPEHGPSCTTFLSRYAQTASRIALMPDLDFFVESTGVTSDSDEAGDE